MRIGIISTFINYHRTGALGGGPLQPGIGPLIAAVLDKMFQDRQLRVAPGLSWPSGRR